MKVNILFVLAFLAVVLLCISDAKSAGSKGGGKKGGVFSKPSKSIPSVSKPKSKSISKSITSTAKKAAVAYVGYKMTRKLYGGGGFFRKPYRSRIFFPVFLPMGGYGYGHHHRHYHGDFDNHGIRCYSCHGRDNDLCATDPRIGATQILCPPRHYCGVVRKEFDSTSSAGANTTTTLIYRDCKSFSSLEEGILVDSNEKSASGMKESATYCATELCNTGDGRLRCFECEGVGNDHACMVNPSRVSKVVTCAHNEFCHVLQLTNTSEPDNSTDTSDMTISRGCKLYSTKDDDVQVGQNDDDEDAPKPSILTLSCASDYCNAIDGNQLFQHYLVNSATNQISSWTVLALLLACSPVGIHFFK